MVQDSSDYRELRIAAESRRAQAIERAEEYVRRVRAVVWLIALAAYGVGVALILWSYHIAGEEHSRVALWGGITVCVAAPYVTWIIAFVLGRERGWWE
jgi:uncharacterized membrane protein